MKGGNIIFNVCQLAVRFVDKGIHSDVALVCWLVMLVIGLTGSIASGKSTTCQILARIAPSLPIIDADKLSHEATKKGNLPYLLLRYIVLPTNCFEPRTGELNRAQLAALIFAPTEKAKCLKKIVERCIHPWVIFRMLLAMCYYWICGYSRMVLDIPLLFEVKLSWMCSKTVLIDVSSEELQLERLLKRNPQMTLSEAKNRIASQFSLERKRKLADIIIVNSGNIHELEKHILKAFQSKSLNPNPIVQLVIFLILPVCLFICLMIWAVRSQVTLAFLP